MAERFRRRFGNERGAVLVLVTVLMIAILGMAALVVDVGSWYLTRRQVQAAADAGALAGVQDLPGNATNAVADAKAYAADAVSGATTTVTTPYNSSTSQIQVTVTKSDPSTFGRLLGITSTSVTASSVAAATATSSQAAALVAFGTTCGNSEGEGIYINNSNVTMPQGLVSNAGVTMAGTGGVYGASTYKSSCSFAPNSGSTANTFGGAGKYSPTGVTTTAAVPNTFSGFPAPSACTYGPPPLPTPAVVLAQNGDQNGTDLNLQNLSGATLPSGTYCYSSIEFNSDNMVGNVTFQASSFQLNDAEPGLTPYYQGLLLYYTGTSSLNVNCNGSDSYLTGGIYSPNAAIYLNSPQGTIDSFVEAPAITLAGGGPINWTSTLTSTSGGASTYALTQ